MQETMRYQVGKSSFYDSLITNEEKIGLKCVPILYN